MTYYLQVTEANHPDNAFYTLGGAGWDTKDERDEQFKVIPAFKHDCDSDNKCYILDLVDENGDITGDKEIAPETAHRILGVDDFEPLRQDQRDIFGAL